MTSPGPVPVTPDLQQPLTDDERRAIASLHRLAKGWPQSLKLFSASGSLAVVRTESAPDEFAPLEWIAGIPNDGGDP